MLIHSLTLENVKSYAQETVRFNPGTNAIVGRNGAGKTTILEAIGFALFDHRPGRLSGFVREGQRSASVTVAFLSDHDERTYQVKRRWGNNDLYRVLDPQLSLKICEGKADVTQFLRQHLGIDRETNPADLFRNAVGVPQGSFTASFLTTPAVRKGVFDPLLKVAEYRRAYEQLREPLNLLKERISDQAFEIGRLEGELKRLPAAQTDVRALTTRISSAVTNLRAVQTELAAAESDRRAMEAKQELLQELQRMTQMQQKDVTEQERILDSARRRQSESEGAVAVTEANRADHDAYRAAQREQSTVNERSIQRRRLQDERNVVQTRLTQAEAQTDAHSRVLADIVEAERTAAALAEAANRQEELESDLRVAQRQADRLRDTGARLRKDQAAADAAKERLDRLRTEAEQAKKIESSLNPLQAHVESFQNEISAAQASAARLLAQKETTQEQGQRLTASKTSAICPICEQPLSAEHRQQLLVSLRKRWSKLNGDAQAVEQKIRQLEAKREEARSNLTRNERTLRQLPRQNAVKTAEEELAARCARLAEDRDATEALEDAPQRAERLRQELDALGNPRRRRDVAIQKARERDAVERALRRQQALAEQQRRNLSELDERMAPFANAEAEAARISSQLEQHQAADDLFRRHQAAAEALPQRRQEAAEAEKMLRAARASYESGLVQLADCRDEFDEKRFREIVALVDDTRSRMVRLETELGHWRADLRRAKEELAQLQARQKRLVVARSGHDRLTQQEELLGFLRSVLREAGPYVTKALVQQISHAANQLFGQIMEDYTHTLRWQEDYEIVLEVEGRERTFSQLSGGEQMGAALAVRLALLQEMSDIAVAFFDEPTSNLDDARRVALARQIVGVPGFQQLFIISHDDSFEQATETLIRVEKRNGVSEVFYQ